jgi:hypothetical protein
VSVLTFKPSVDPDDYEEYGEGEVGLEPLEWTRQRRNCERIVSVQAIADEAVGKGQLQPRARDFMEVMMMMQGRSLRGPPPATPPPTGVSVSC